MLRDRYGPKLAFSHVMPTEFQPLAGEGNAPAAGAGRVPGPAVEPEAARAAVGRGDALIRSRATTLALEQEVLDMERRLEVARGIRSR